MQHNINFLLAAANGGQGCLAQHRFYSSNAGGRRIHSFRENNTGGIVVYLLPFHGRCITPETLRMQITDHHQAKS